MGFVADTVKQGSMSPSSPAGSSSSSLPFSNTLLALPDGPIPASHPDRSNHTVSTIGGYPTFPLPVEAANITCGECNRPIPVLAQVYCPPENGENDRTVYVFACGRAACQRKKRAVRAWRASRRNEEYVRDVEARRKQKEEEERKLAEERRKNPFTMANGNDHASSLFGASSNLFGAANPFTSTNAPDSGSSPEVSSALMSSAPPDISKLSLSSSPPAPAETAEISGPTSLKPPHPAYFPPQYLTTIDEYLPPPEEMDIDDDDDDDETEGAAAEKAEMRNERWEQLLPGGQDALFERFVKRIGDADGGESQVIRYELGGVPLPYSSSPTLTADIFPGLAAACKAQRPEDEDPSLSAFYKTDKIPKCSKCKSERVFELQLLPSLINILVPESLSTTGNAAKRNGKKKLSEEERRKELERLAKSLAGETTDDAPNSGDDVSSGGMEWGTIMVFGCKADCTGFTEEHVGVEWESRLGETM